MPKIRAKFEKMSSGRKAVESLRGMGFKNAHLDAIESFDEEYSSEINAAGAGAALNLSALVLKSKAYLTSPERRAPLAAASHLVSGISSHQDIADGNTNLLLNVDEDKVDEVKKLITSFGGTF